jgi:hypothetical protein
MGRWAVMATIIRRPAKQAACSTPDADRPPTDADVEVVARNLRAYLRNDGTDKPWCTCFSTGGYSFDGQIGVWLHGDPNCWKPSKAYYEAALRAGIVKPPRELE